MNTPKTGRIYHVVNQLTGEIVKVGSTTQSIRKRQQNKDYKIKYQGFFLKEIRVIQSSELDLFEPGNPYCPFLWHLVAAEHLEILRVGTFQKSKLSNQQSPLDQKYFGFDSAVGSPIGSKLGGKRYAELYGSPATPEGSLKGALNQKVEDKARGGRTQGLIQGKKNLESGLWNRVVSAGGKASGKSKSEAKQKTNFINGERFGRWSVESGHLAKQRTSEHQKKASLAGVHRRCHVNRNIINPECKLCQGIVECQEPITMTAVSPQVKE